MPESCSGFIVIVVFYHSLSGMSYRLSSVCGSFRHLILFIYISGPIALHKFGMSEQL